MLTYAQNFEDVMLERLFREVEEGFYVDIGAWDPTIHSVTRHFYDRGWRGVNIDPIAARIATFAAERPRDINLAVAIGPRPGTMTFFECVEESYLSTLDAQVAGEMRERGLTVREHAVPVVTIAQIFEEHCPAVVDFLKIDVEGFEGELLRDLDLRRFRPRALVVEATRPAMAPSSWDDLEAIGTWDAWEPRVLASGYVFAHFDGLNRFYLREEDAHLASRLRLPPTVFDEMEPAAAHAVKTERLAVQEDRSAKDMVIDRLAAELAAIDHDRRLKQEIVDRLIAENDAIESDRNAKQAVVDRLIGEVEAIRDDRDAKQVVVDKLVAEMGAIRADRDAKQAVIERLAAEIGAVRADGDAKQRVVDRLIETARAVSADRDLKGAVVTRLETEVGAIGADRDAKATVVERLVAELAAVEQDRGAKQARLDDLARELAEVRRDRDEKATVADRLAAELSGVEQDRHAKQARLDELAREFVAVRHDRDEKAKVISRLLEQLSDGSPVMDRGTKE